MSDLDAARAHAEAALADAGREVVRVERLLTVLELAVFWRCHRNTIYSYIRKGLLTVERVPGGGIRIRESAVAKCGPPP